MKTRYFTSRGAALTEYGILAGLVSLSAIAAVSLVGREVRDTYSQVSMELSTASAEVEAGGVEVAAPPARYDFSSIGLINGGADGTVDPWVGDYILRGDPCAEFFFASDRANSRSSQIVEIPEEGWPDVDDGAVTAVLDWMQSSYADVDKAGLEIGFLSADGDVIGSEASPVSSTYRSVWTHRWLEKELPPLTRSLRVTMVGERAAGSNSDGYLDDINLDLLTDTVLHTPGQLRNPSGATLQGWHTTENFTVRNYDARGMHFDGGPRSSLSTAYQEVKLTVAQVDAANAGDLSVSIDWKQGSDSGNDAGWISLGFLDAWGNLISAETAEELAAPGEGAWIDRNLTAAVPAGAHSVRVKMHARKHVGNNNDAFFQDLERTWQ